jgi:glycosyltransferase involved in cell wall biosynthesis
MLDSKNKFSRWYAENLCIYIDLFYELRKRMDKLITVIIPVRNGEAFIEKAIESVLSQLVHSFKIIISDNGSTDSTASILLKYAQDPRVKIVVQTEQLDMFGHFNKCLEMVDTKYFMMLHHDDFLYDTSALGQAYFVLEKYPAIAAVYSDMIFVDKVEKVISNRAYKRTDIVKADDIAFASVTKTRNLFGIPILMRTKLVANHRYDNSLTYSADLDFSIAISRKGDIYHINKILVAYRIHGLNASVSLFKLAFEEMVRIAEKYNIKINSINKGRMFMNAYFVALQKWLYFKYLDNIRRYK